MNKSTLLNSLREMGYPLFETEKQVDANKTLAEVVKTKDPRLWEGFPLLLANSLEKRVFSYSTVVKNLENKQDKRDFRNLTLLSLALYEYLNLRLFDLNELYSDGRFNKKSVNKLLAGLREKKDLGQDGLHLSSVRVLNTFKNYYTHPEVNLKEYVNLRDEFDLEYSFSQLLSRKQRELFLKKLKGEKMTKTEREYYSRSVKGKVLALANSDLHKLATKLVK
ncbi:hypothetical protein ACFLT2_07000 [Acidobacteriota bacterium]